MDEGEASKRRKKKKGKERKKAQEGFLSVKTEKIETERRQGGTRGGKESDGECVYGRCSES